MVAPTFLVPGVTRAGTTSLHYYLRPHDDICLPEKELRFFDRDREFEEGLESYEDQFGEDPDAAVHFGDVSPSYWLKGITFDRNGDYRFDPDDDSIHRIHEAYPDIKIIFSLRNPVTRAHSQYTKNLRQGREPADSFIEALEEELKGQRSHTETGMCWIYQNRYSVHISKWLDLFDEENILFLVFENWVQDPKQGLNRICDFLEVERRDTWSRTDETKESLDTPRFPALYRLYHNSIKPLRENPAVSLSYRALKRTGVHRLVWPLFMTEGRNLSQREREYAEDAFYDDIKRTEELIGKDLDIWLDNA